MRVSMHRLKRCHVPESPRCSQHSNLPRALSTVSSHTPWLAVDLGLRAGFACYERDGATFT